VIPQGASAGLVKERSQRFIHSDWSKHFSVL
jgi:hypothetical protein